MTAKKDGTQGILEELKGNASLCEALLEGVPVGIFLVDGQYAVLHVNPLLEKWLGRRKKDVLGKKCHEVLFGHKDPCNHGGQTCPTGAALASGKATGQATFRRQTPGGMHQHLRVHSWPILDETGSPRCAVEFIQDVTPEVLLRDYREEAALRDPLTGLYNRQGFNHLLGRELKRTRRQGHPLSLCLVDLDSFKDFNEKKGEKAGDALLEKLTGILVAHTRVGVDSPARLQADTFALILPEASREQALRIGSRIQMAAMETKLPVSISMAICESADSEDSDGFYRRAADVLFQAKKSGGNRIL